MRQSLHRGLLAAAVISAGLVAAPARAQARQAYYYPAAGYYETTTGTTYIPSAGYYYNVPASAPARNPAPRSVVIGGLTINIIRGLPPAARSNVPTYNPTDPW